MRTFLLLAAASMLGVPAGADVVDSAEHGFAVRNVAQIAVRPSGAVTRQWV